MGPYYEPEKYGLEILGVAESPLSYEYDMFVVWTDKRGDLYWAEDSGCSCSSPFSECGLNDLVTGTVAECHRDLDEWAKDHSDAYWQSATLESVAELHEALAGLRPAA